jgi:hypothetical protein
VSPLIPTWSDRGKIDGYAYWSHQHFVEQCERTQVFEDGESAAQWYPHADVGGVTALLGSPWMCCPRWHAAFAPPAVSLLASKALRLVRWREHGALSEITATPLIPAAVDLIQLAEAARAAQEARELDAIRNKNKR